MSQQAPNPYVLRLEALEAIVKTQAARIQKLEQIITGFASVLTGGVEDIASDRDLDSHRGDEKIRFDARDWKGPSHKGRTMSASEPDFLDMYGDAALYFASKNTDATKAGYDRKTAARAAGWARRLRAGWTPPPPPPKPTLDGGPKGDGFGSTGGGFGAGTTRAWGSDGDSFSNGKRGFLGGAPPAAPSSDPDAGAGDDVSFEFGANVGRATEGAKQIPVEADDDDPPM